MSLEGVAVDRRLSPGVSQGDEDGQVAFGVGDALVEELPGARLFEMFEDIAENYHLILAQVIDHIERIPDVDSVVDGPLVILNVIRVSLDAVDAHLPSAAVIGLVQHHIEAVSGQKPPLAVP